MHAILYVSANIATFVKQANTVTMDANAMSIVTRKWLVFFYVEHLYHFTHLHRALVVLGGIEGNAGF